MKSKKYGICALTGVEGKFVKSHILPQALTRPSVSGAPLFQSSRGKGFNRRWSSWYDSNLVTREGEDLLSEIDDKAIKLLRGHKLVWGSWVVYRPHFEGISPAIPTHSYRELTLSNDEAKALLRFVISIAWRVSASTLSDFENLKFLGVIEKDLRRALTEPDADDWKKYPASLIQLTTQGGKHNHSPYVSTKTIPSYENEPEKKVNFLRVYLDGLVVHFHFEGYGGDRGVDGPLFVGGGSKLAIIGITYEASFQYENLLVNAMESYGPLDGWLSKL